MTATSLLIHKMLSDRQKEQLALVRAILLASPTDNDRPNDTTDRRDYSGNPTEVISKA